MDTNGNIDEKIGSQFNSIFCLPLYSFGTQGAQFCQNKDSFCLYFDLDFESFPKFNQCFYLQDPEIQKYFVGREKYTNKCLRLNELSSHGVKNCIGQPNIMQDSLAFKEYCGNIDSIILGSDQNGQPLKEGEAGAIFCQIGSCKLIENGETKCYKLNSTNS